MRRTYKAVGKAETSRFYLSEARFITTYVLRATTIERSN